MHVDTPVDLSGTFAGDLHGVLRAAASRGPLAVDELTGAVLVLRQRDLEVLAHDQRLPGIGLALFDMMGIADGPLRDWYGKLMFTTEGDYHRRIRSLVSRVHASIRRSAACDGRRTRGNRGRVRSDRRGPSRSLRSGYTADLPAARGAGQ